MQSCNKLAVIGRIQRLKREGPVASSTLSIQYYHSASANATEQDFVHCLLVHSSRKTEKNLSMAPMLLLMNFESVSETDRNVLYGTKHCAACILWPHATDKAVCFTTRLLKNSSVSILS